MKKHVLIVCLLAAAALVVGSACVGGGDGDIDIDGKADGYGSDFDPDPDSREPWNYQNDPRRWRESFEYNWERLREVVNGASENVPWPDTYWPMTADGYNARWQGNDTMSPLELYDLAFNNWTPPEGFMELRRFSGARSEYDAAYYEQYGPAARWGHERGGHYRARQIWNPDGTLVESVASVCDTDGDNRFDSDAPVDQCDYNRDEQVGSGDELGGLEGWWGHCHAWAPAAYVYPEAQHSVEHNGVTFEVADLKALAESTMEGGGSVFLGDRCNAREFERDEFGRVTDEHAECRDTNAGAFHVITVNVVGRMSKSYVADVTQGYQVWNQPIRDYTLTRQDEITAEQACTLLGRDGETEYPYNSAAERFVHVEMTWRYVVEGHASATPYLPQIDSYTRTKNLEYILELSEDGTIIGGEWIDTEMPDFLWSSVHQGNDVRNSFYDTIITAENVRGLIDQAVVEPEPEPDPEPEPTLTCGDAPVLEAGQAYTSSTEGDENRYEANCAGSARSPEDVYRLVLTEPARVVVRVEADYDCAVYMRSSCDDAATELACNDDFEGDYNTSQFETDLEPGTYFVFVDGYSSSSSGPYQVRYEIAE